MGQGAVLLAGPLHGIVGDKVRWGLGWIHELLLWEQLDLLCGQLLLLREHVLHLLLLKHLYQIMVRLL